MNNIVKLTRFSITILIFLSLYSTAGGQIDYYHFDSLKAEKLMFSAINRIRLENHLPLFRKNDDLKKLAELHARDMINRDFFDHVNPDGDSPRERAQKHGIPYPVSENLGVLSSYGLSLQDVIEEFLQSLLDSPEHRANLLNPNITEIGLAFSQDKDQSTSIIDTEEIGDSKLGYGTVVVCQTFMKRGFRKLEPDPFPDKLDRGASIHLVGETYRDFDSVLIKLEETVSQKLMKTAEINLIDRTFEDSLFFRRKGNYDIRIVGNTYEDENEISSEELFSFNVTVD